MSVVSPRAQMPSAPQRPLLGRAMIENAWFSGVSGITLAIGAPGLDSWLGVNAWVLVAIGVGLAVFALDLVIWARSSRWLRRGATVAVAGDVLWVMGAVILITSTSLLTSEGDVALALVTVVVALLAVIQAVGLARLGNAAD